VVVGHVVLFVVVERPSCDSCRVMKEDQERVPSRRFAMSELRPRLGSLPVQCDCTSTIVRIHGWMQHSNFNSPV
jgi:hypothetical protein